MRAPVRNDAVRTVRRVTPAAVAFDSVEGNAGRDRKFVYRAHERALRGKCIDAIWNAIKLSQVRICASLRDGADRQSGKKDRGLHQLPRDLSNPIGSHHTAAMWRRDKNHTAHVRSMIEDQRFLEKLFGFRRNIGLRGRFSKALAPDLVPDVRDHEPADHSAHAVTDEDDALAIRERARNRIQLLAEKRRRVGIGITTRITVNPKLIAS